MIYTCTKTLEDKKIIDGKMNYQSLKELLSKIEPNSIVYLFDETYYGKFYLNEHDIKIIGNNSIITYDVSNGTIIKDEDGGDGIKKYGTTGSSSFTLLDGAYNFTMENVTVKNQFNPVNVKSGTQAVAFKTSAKNGIYKNCTFLSFQDTLYVDEGLNMFFDCTVSGDVDFIFGGGDAIFDNCTLNLIKRDGHKYAYLCAPDTYIDYKYGYIFNNCTITCQKGLDAYLGRAWYPSNASREVMPRAFFFNCSIDPNINPSMIQMHEGDKNNYKIYIKDCKICDKIYLNTENEIIVKYYLDYINEMVNYGRNL